MEYIAIGISFIILAVFGCAVVKIYDDTKKEMDESEQNDNK